MMQIDGAVVAITGASGGMGGASARYLAERGAKVVLGVRNEERLRGLVGEITAARGAATHLPIDVRRREDVRAPARHAVATFGRLDVFVANAGTMPTGPVDDLALDDWETMVDVNVKGVFRRIAALSLLELSRISSNATLYFDTDRWGSRGSVATRNKYAEKTPSA